MINKKTSELDSMCQNDSVNERMSQWVTELTFLKKWKLEWVRESGIYILYLELFRHLWMREVLVYNNSFNQHTVLHTTSNLSLNLNTKFKVKTCFTITLTFIWPGQESGILRAVLANTALIPLLTLTPVFRKYGFISR